MAKAVSGITSETQQCSTEERELFLLLLFFLRARKPSQQPSVPLARITLCAGPWQRNVIIMMYVTKVFQGQDMAGGIGTKSGIIRKEVR